MTEQPERCPFCDEAAIPFAGKYNCPTVNCPARNAYSPLETWNRRAGGSQISGYAHQEVPKSARGATEWNVSQEKKSDGAHRVTLIFHEDEKP